MTKIAIVQQPPVYLDLGKTIVRAVKLIEDAAHEGAQLVVFPEAWFPGYPTFIWRLSPGAGMGKTDELYTRLQANSIDLSRGDMAPLQEAAKQRSKTRLSSSLAIRSSTARSVAVPCSTVASSSMLTEPLPTTTAS